MAEATGLRQSLPYPVYGAPFGFVIPITEADGDLVTSAAGLDSEISKNGDTLTDCTNEATEIGGGLYYLILTATEMTADVVSGVTKTSTADAETTSWSLYPRKLVTVRSGTAAGGDTGYITLDASASAVDDYYNGMVCIATIDSTVEARVITDYTGSNKRAAVVPDWNTVPDSDDTFVIKLPEGVQLPTVDVTYWAGVAVAAADANGNVPVVLYGTQPAVTFGKIIINSGGYSPALQFVSALSSAISGATGLEVTLSSAGVAQVTAAVPDTQDIADALLLAPVGEAADGSAMAALETLSDQLDALPADTWSYTTRTLTQSSTSTTDSTAAGSIARRRGDSWSISLTIGAITGYTSLWFTAKWDRDNTDAQSVIQIKKNASGSGDGLLYVNGATATNAALATITVTDATTGAIVIAVDETVTDDLPPAGIPYDVQVKIGDTVSTPDSGTLTISADVTRAVA